MDDDQNKVVDSKDEKDGIAGKKERIDNKKGKEGKNNEVRKSERIRKQRMTIHPDQIGDCDDEQDLDYK